MSACPNYQSQKKKKFDVGSQLELEKIMCIILALCLGCRVNLEKIRYTRVENVRTFLGRAKLINNYNTIAYINYCTKEVWY